MPVLIQRQVTVKVIMTEKRREALLRRYHRDLHQLQVELEQLEFQGRKWLNDASKRGADAVKTVQERLYQEVASRKEKMAQRHIQIDQVELIPLDAEVIEGTVNSQVDVQVGDHWDELVDQAEIIVKDGIVVEIRQGREKTHEH